MLTDPTRQRTLDKSSADPLSHGDRPATQEDHEFRVTELSSARCSADVSRLGRHARNTVYAGAAGRPGGYGGCAVESGDGSAVSAESRPSYALLAAEAGTDKMTARKRAQRAGTADLRSLGRDGKSYPGSYARNAERDE